MASSPGKAPSRTQADVWKDLFDTVAFLGETLELAQQAMTPDNVAMGDKVVSLTTKRRIMTKSLQNLKQSKEYMQVLHEHLKALQAASQSWQRTMLNASKSHDELMEQLENTNRDLQLTMERLRKVEAQHLASVREAEAQRMHILKIEADFKAGQGLLKQREEELETAHFAHVELEGRLQQYQQEAAAARDDKLAAEQARDRAIAALDGVKAEADKATAAAQRHQEAVAKLTADNLVFIMSLKKAEADLAVANQERAQLKLAAEKQRGPWFDEVRANVEERVKQAMSSAEALGAELEAQRAQHATQLKELEEQKADLEEYVTKLRAREDTLEKQLAEAHAACDHAEARYKAAALASDKAHAQADELAMRNKVLQDQVAQMRQECTERWVAEQDAVGKVQGLQNTIASLEDSLSELQVRVQELGAELATQHEINRQLMQKKEQTEWELMAALAKAAAPSVTGPSRSVPPLSHSQYSTPARSRDGPPAPPPSTSAALARPHLLSLQAEEQQQGAAGQMRAEALASHPVLQEAPRSARPGAPITVPMRDLSTGQLALVPQQSSTPAHSPRQRISGTGSLARAILEPEDQGAYSAYVFDLRKSASSLGSPVVSPPPARPGVLPGHPVLNASQEVGRNAPLPAPLPGDVAADPDRKTVQPTPTTPTALMKTVQPPNTQHEAAALVGEGRKTPEYVVNGGSLVPVPTADSVPPQAVRTSSVLSEQKSEPAPSVGSGSQQPPSTPLDGDRNADAQKGPTDQHPLQPYGSPQRPSSHALSNQDGLPCYPHHAHHPVMHPGLKAADEASLLEPSGIKRFSAGVTTTPPPKK